MDFREANEKEKTKAKETLKTKQATKNPFAALPMIVPRHLMGKLPELAVKQMKEYETLPWPMKK